MKNKNDLNQEINYLNYSPSVFFRWKNSENWPVLYVSENVSSLFDATSEDFVNGTISYSKLIHPDDLELVQTEVIESSISTLNEFKHRPYRIQSKKGWIWVEDSTRIIRDKDGNVLEYYGYISDLTHMKNLELELAKINSDTYALMKALDKSYLISKADIHGDIIFVNEKFCEISGYEETELIGKNHNIVSHPKTSSSTFKDLWATILSKKVWHGILQNMKKNGESYYVDMTIKPILDKNGSIIEFIAIRHEVSELIEKQLKLTKSLRESVLLKIPNRLALFERITEESNLIAAQIDIDAFHELNDFFGYEAGDFVLKELVTTIKSTVPKDIELYHIQADQFVLITNDLNYDKFKLICQILQGQIHGKNFINGDNELSIRVTFVTSNEPSLSLARSLDMAHDYAKKNAKSFVEYSQECDFSEQYNKNLESLHKVKSAFKEDRIVPFYQALYNNRTNTIEKYEVLARLIEEDGTVLSPYHFLDAIYKAKMNQRLTQVIMTKAFAYFKELPYSFSINLALSDMLNKKLLDFIMQALEDFPEPSRVVFEILESESIENFDPVSDFISRVKAFGCKIAIDDFGSGYANFENLIKLDADFIKIDGSLIKELDVNNDARDIIGAIEFFARKKRIATIAEFVSSEAIMLQVKELGIDFSQGYHIHEPSPIIKEVLPTQDKEFKSLIYVSQSSEKITYEKAQEILNASYSKNHNKEIYGVLIYKDDYFVQCIEGEAKLIDTLYDKIAQDKRHANLKLIGERRLSTLNFDQWNMSYIPNDDAIAEIFDKYLISQKSGLYKAHYENMLELLKDLTKVI